MKNGLFFFCVVLICLFVTTYPNYELNVNNTTQQINRRFYLINRLMHIVRLVLEDRQMARAICYQKLSINSFTHPLIQQTVQALQNEKNISALISRWEEFIAYRLINDTLFEAEFMRLIFLICYDISSVLCKKPLSEKYITLQLYETAPIDDVTFNFYTINRLQKTIQLLEDIHTREKKLASLEINTPKKKIDDQEIQFLEEQTSFHHSKIQECIMLMYDTKNLGPLLELCKEYTQYRYASDHIFLKEQLTLLFFAYKNMLTKKLSGQTEEVIMHEMDLIQEVCEHIEELSVDQILDVIDIVTNKLIAIRTIEEESKSSFATMMYNTFHAIGSLLKW